MIDRKDLETSYVTNRFNSAFQQKNYKKSKSLLISSSKRMNNFWSTWIN